MVVTLLASPEWHPDPELYERKAGDWRQAAARAQAALYKPRPVVLCGYSPKQAEWITETLNNPANMPVYFAHDSSIDDLVELRDRLRSRITVICKNGPFSNWELSELEQPYGRPILAKYKPPPPLVVQGIPRPKPAPSRPLSKPHTPIYDVEPPPTIGLLPDYVWEHLMWEDPDRHSCSPLICEECCSVVEGLECITCGLVYAGR